MTVKPSKASPRRRGALHTIVQEEKLVRPDDPANGRTETATKPYTAETEDAAARVRDAHKPKAATEADGGDPPAHPAAPGHSAGRSRRRLG